MLRPALYLCAVIALGSLITFSVVMTVNPIFVDARGNPLSRLDPQAVEEAANTPCESPRLISAM